MINDILTLASSKSIETDQPLEKVQVQPVATGYREFRRGSEKPASHSQIYSCQPIHDSPGHRKWLEYGLSQFDRKRNKVFQTGW